MNHQKCFREGTCTILQWSVAAPAGSKRLNRSFLRRKVASGLFYFEIRVDGSKAVAVAGSAAGESAPWDVAENWNPVLAGPLGLVGISLALLQLEKLLPESGAQPLLAAIGRFQNAFGAHPYAVAPIRTSPQRTYDPTSADPTPEGAHMPMALANLAHSGSAKEIQDGLSEFGSNSGLFDDIDVVRKGNKESDPFQIGVNFGGPTVNLVDVGYGVSQVLPILVDTIQRAGKDRVFLLQQPEVHLHPRAQAELGSFFARQTRHSRRFVVETHSDYLVDRVRMEVRRETLKPKDVSLLYFERNKSGATIHNLELDKNGDIINPPLGYRQFFLDEERHLLEA
jgi:hypothetical protein